jgi:hypothetical protein
MRTVFSVATAISAFAFLSQVTLGIFGLMTAAQGRLSRWLESVRRHWKRSLAFAAVAFLGTSCLAAVAYSQDEPSLAWLYYGAYSGLFALVLIMSVMVVTLVLGPTTVAQVALIPVAFVFVPSLVVVTLLTLIPFGGRPRRPT